MTSNEDFLQKLTEGQKLEEDVVDELQRLLPGYKVFQTPQDNEIDRYIYKLIDVVVEKDDHILFGIECKYGKEKLRNCKDVNGWDGDYNTVLNRHSLHNYKEAYFPVYILNYNEFCDKAFTADLPTILKSGNDAGRYVKSSGEVRYNVDSRTWNTYDGLDLTRILTDILRKEKLC